MSGQSLHGYGPFNHLILPVKIPRATSYHNPDFPLNLYGVNPGPIGCCSLCNWHSSECPPFELSYPQKWSRIENIKNMIMKAKTWCGAYYHSILKVRECIDDWLDVLAPCLWVNSTLFWCCCSTSFFCQEVALQKVHSPQQAIDLKILSTSMVQVTIATATPVPKYSWKHQSSVSSNASFCPVWRWISLAIL